MEVLIQPRGRFQTCQQSIYLDGHSRLAAHVDLTKMDGNQDGMFPSPVAYLIISQFPVTSQRPGPLAQQRRRAP